MAHVARLNHIPTSEIEDTLTFAAMGDGIESKNHWIASWSTYAFYGCMVEAFYLLGIGFIGSSGEFVAMPMALVAAVLPTAVLSNFLEMTMLQIKELKRKRMIDRLSFELDARTKENSKQ